MSLFLKWLFAVCIWLGFYLLTFKGFQDKLFHKQPAPLVSNPDSIIEEKGSPLYFKWSNPEVYIDKGIELLVEKTLFEGDSNRVLKVTGLYYESETALKQGGNLGLARAAEVGRLFDGKIPNTRIRLRAHRLADADSIDSARIEGVRLKWIGLDEANAVDRLEDRVAIQFPTGSIEKAHQPEVDAYLVELSAQLKESGRVVQLTGHTDNTGSPARNHKLGLARAEAIKDLLVSKGVPAAQLLTASEGGSLPVASNDTEEGKDQNRRVEVQFIESALLQQNE
ncbi:MAG: OmpA family protein [Mameliella sp.]|nr:OmpA family protein [Phaeodactylibacter sp.]